MEHKGYKIKEVMGGLLCKVGPVTISSRTIGGMVKAIDRQIRVQGLEK